MSSPPQVSIGMPVFNGERYLRCAIETILAQTFQDFELIIADNCSTDETVSICKEYAAKDKRIRLIQNENNIGAIPNFNLVANEARGEYFKWAASDDICDPEFLELCVEVLDAQPDVAWCHCASDKIDEDGKSWREILKPDDELFERRADNSIWWKGHPRKNLDSNDPIMRFSSILLGTTWCVDSYGLIRANVLRQTRLLVPYYGAEKVLMAELAIYGKYVEVPDLLFRQRVHCEASSNLGTSKKQASFVAIKRRFVSTRLSLLWAHIYSIFRSNLSFVNKIRGLVAVTKYLLQFKKWSRIFSNAFRGKGVGGGGAEMITKRTRIGQSN